MPKRDVVGEGHLVGVVVVGVFAALFMESHRAPEMVEQRGEEEEGEEGGNRGNSTDAGTCSQPVYVGANRDGGENSVQPCPPTT